MAFKVLLDANVLIDFFLKREEYETTEKLFDGIFNNKYSVFITPAILHITAYYTKKKLGFTTSKALLLDLLSNSKLINCDHQTAVLALSSKMADVEDALQYYTALQHGLDFVITQDKQFQKQAIPSLPIYSPQEFLTTFID